LCQIAEIAPRARATGASHVGIEMPVF